MLEIFKVFLLCTFLNSCESSQSNFTKQSVSGNSVGNNSIQTLLSGKYNETSIAIDSNNLITGYYGYYDAWDENYKEYTQVCLFYFTGKYKNDSIISIVAGWPTSDQKLKGFITVKPKGLSIALDDAPYGYAAEDFTIKDGYCRALQEPKKWIQVRLIKTPKAKLFSAPDSTKLLKAYFVKNDPVKVLQTIGAWYKVEFTAPNSKSKPITAWIQEPDLYGPDPSKW